MLNYNKVGHFLFFSLILLNVLPEHSLLPGAHAISEIASDVSSEQTLTLSQHPTWRRLLKFRPNEPKSQLISRDFFLAENGSTDPHQELIATLREISRPFPKQSYKHAICKYPARSYWLEQKLNLDLEKLRQAHCIKLMQWMKPASLSSISLLMVSGYFGNPASTYGHVIIKLNNGEENDTFLQNQSINFGALIPENENTLVYILKGLFGGYTAGFSDRKFYTQDLIYTRIESRDMWEYELKLEQSQLKLLVYHLWELVGKKFTYFFLKNNCAYHVTSLLEIAYDENLINDHKAWYLPVETFYALRGISASKGKQTYVSPKYIASRKSKLYTLFESFPQTLQQQINLQVELILKDLSDQVALQKLSENPLVLEFLLEYIDYKFLNLDGSYKKNVELLRSKLLLARLKLPKGQKTKEPDVYNLPAPSIAPKPHLIAPFIKYSSDYGNDFGLRFSPAYFDSIGGNKGQLEHSDLTTLETIVASNSESGLYLEKMDILRIRQLAINTTSLKGERNRSWQLRAGFARRAEDCFRCNTFLLEGGTGKAVEFNKGLVGYAMATGYYSSAGSEIGVGANLGLTYQPKAENIKMGLELQLSPSPPVDDNNYLIKSEMRYSLNKNSQLRATFENSQDSSLMFSIFHYF